ncbi:MAG: hypothetical protein PHO02_02175 [Candidatus Nanoarchaeia archaeon]|nr:hypothetical protein [Candidatus Nanoarchaeia archaeon]
MLKFLRKLFENKEEKEKVDFFEIEKHIAEKAWNSVRADIERLQKAREAVLRNIESLEKKDIDSVKVQDKAKDVVKGNRNAYVIMLRKFADSIEPPSELTADSILLFCRKFEAEIIDFNNKTARNYFIMKTLIGEELEAIRKNLKEVESVLVSLKKDVETGRLSSIEDLQRQLTDIYRHIENKGEHEKEMKKIGAEIELLMSKEKDVTERINAMKNGREFIELENHKSKLQQKTDEEAAIKARIKSSFAEIARPLRKYENAYPSKILTKFLEDPVAAMEENEGIARILHSAAESMQKGEIDSKNPEKDVQNLQELSSKFDEMKERMILIEKEKEEIKENIRNNKAEEERDKMIKELNKIEGELSEAEEKLDALKKKDIKKDIAKVKEDLKKIGLDAELKNVPYE